MHALRHARRLALRTAGLALVLAVLGGACGFSTVLDKRQVASRIADSYDRARLAGVMNGHAETSLTIEKLKLPVKLPGFKPGMTIPGTPVATTADVGRSQLVGFVDLGKGPQPVQAFDEAVFYQRNSEGGHARPWLALNIGRLYDERATRRGDAAGNNLLNPVYLYQLLPGVLTGSIKTLGHEAVEGVPTTHYSANFDAERAIAHAPKVRREAILTAFDLMGARHDAIRGEVWLDDHGLPRKVLMRLQERFQRRVILSVNVTLVVAQTGVATPVPIPARDEAAGTTDLGAVAQSAVRLLSKLAGGAGKAAR